MKNIKMKSLSQFINEAKDVKLNKLAKTGRLKDTNTGFTYYKLAKIDLLYAEWK